MVAEWRYGIAPQCTQNEFLRMCRLRACQRSRVAAREIIAEGCLLRPARMSACTDLGGSGSTPRPHHTASFMPHRPIEILRIVTLRGPNLWTYRQALEAWVDIGDLEDHPSNTLPGFYERLVSWLPGLEEHHCSEGARGGFLSRLREGTWPAHIMEHVTLELQNLIGQRTGFGKARSTSRRGVYRVVVRSRQEEVTRACLYAARDLVMAAINDQPHDLPAVLTTLRDLVETHYPRPQHRLHRRRPPRNAAFPGRA